MNLHGGTTRDDADRVLDASLDAVFGEPRGDALSEPARGGRLLARPGRNCWRLERSERVAVLADADNYFRRLVEVLSRACRSVFILGWDIDSRLDLQCEDPGGPVRLAEFLDGLAARQRRLRIHVLCWDYNALLALDRERGTAEQLGRRTHRHVRFRFDSKHPLGACHHQKLVVVDDTVAFVGGLDLTVRRWDTCAHRADEPRRVDPAGASYPPFHDVQAIVSGEAAFALGQLARHRWHRASRRHVPWPARRPVAELWPADLVPDLVDVPVAIARTIPAFARQPAVREVRQHVLDAIAAARHSIYIENQYFTAVPIAEALAARLAEPDGPEIVLVLPRLCSGWLEQHTIGALRVAALKLLQAGDVHGRLRQLHPMASRERDLHVFVHSKVVCIDDRLLRIGSANFNNRSLGIDTECDVGIEAATPEHRRGIAAVRNRLLAEQLGVTAEQVDEVVARTGSLIAAVDGLPSGDRAPLGPGTGENGEAGSGEAGPGLFYEFGVDPEGPMELSRVIDRFLPEVVDPGWRKHRREVAVGLATALLLVGLVLAWQFEPVRHNLSLERVSRLVEHAREQPAAPLFVVAGFIVSAILVVPPSAAMLVTVVTFGAWPGVLWALIGTLAGHVAIFGLGRWFGGAIIDGLPNSGIARLAGKVRTRSAFTILLLRLLPIAPASAIDIACGAARVRWSHFVVGSAVGALPALALTAAFGVELRHLGSGESLVPLVLLGLIAACGVAGTRVIRRYVKAHELANEPPPQMGP